MKDDGLSKPFSIQINDYSWGMAPRQSGAPPGHPVNHERETLDRKMAHVVLCEYYFLAGHLFRWYRLYNTALDGNSWVWQWFRHGKIWKIGNKLFGSEVVNRITEEFAVIVE